MDMLLLNQNAEPVAIFEFKKHTLSPDVSGQTLSNYYPSPDGRKYNSLAIFKEYFFNHLGLDIPIIIIFYLSNANGKFGRAEALTEGPGNLKVKAGGKFSLPVDTSHAEQQRILSLIPKIIKLYRA
ncbi:hypothetical protein [Sphingobacterium cellulitidis]|uniref:hypothetical protein n=1 Tax=Sphingobacterium cellulitidis TaxID=1768011 RepID=UPI0011405ECF